MIKQTNDKLGRIATEQRVDTKLCTCHREIELSKLRVSESLLRHLNVEIVFVTQLSRQPIIFLILASLQGLQLVRRKKISQFFLPLTVTQMTSLASVRFFFETKLSYLACKFS